MADRVMIYLYKVTIVAIFFYLIFLHFLNAVHFKTLNMFIKHISSNESYRGLDIVSDYEGNFDYGLRKYV